MAECDPLDTLEALEAWSAEGIPSCHIASALNSGETKLPNRPRTLVCHDLDGNYHEDRFVDGCFSACPYRFVHWAYVDIFVYFSHHFITIPPIGWTEAAHRNGVPILGTFITEWDGGAKLCEDIFSDEERMERVVKQLALIAATLRFDGWLINIENLIKGEHVEMMRRFVSRLCQECRDLIGPSSHVIWYDSVTESGKLKWQNELNYENRQFFDACDGIFLNYTWKPETLERSAELAKSCQRLYDVYVGVDVFGRGLLGDGGFNTSQAMDCIRKYDLSCAIFAPGWVYQKLPIDSFQLNQQKFWLLLKDWLACRPVTHPLEVSFCDGLYKSSTCGPAYVADSRCCGESNCDTYFAIQRQSIQPHFLCGRPVMQGNASKSLERSFYNLLVSLKLSLRSTMLRSNFIFGILAKFWTAINSSLDISKAYSTADSEKEEWKMTFGCCDTNDGIGCCLKLTPLKFPEDFRLFCLNIPAKQMQTCRLCLNLANLPSDFVSIAGLRLTVQCVEPNAEPLNLYLLLREKDEPVMLPEECDGECIFGSLEKDSNGWQTWAWTLRGHSEDWEKCTLTAVDFVVMFEGDLSPADPMSFNVMLKCLSLC